jgi:hypothetical protein
MKNKKQTHRKISAILDDYNSILNEYKTTQNADKISLIQEEAKETLAYRNKIDKLGDYLLLFIALLLIFFYSMFVLVDIENDNLQTDIIEKQNVINQLQITDSLFNQLIGSNYNFRRDENGEIITYNELGKQNENLVSEKNAMSNLYDFSQNEIINLREIYQNETSKTHWADSLFSIIMPVKIAGHSRYIPTALDREGKIITYEVLIKTSNILVSKYDSILIINQNLLMESNKVKQKLNMAEKYYDIRFIESDSTITIMSDKVDSALLILPYYRHKLKYDQKNKIWTIK